MSYSIGRAESVIQDARGAMLAHVASSAQEEMAQMEASIAEDQRKAKELLKSYEKTILRARDRELYEKIGPANDRWMAAWEKPRTLSRAGKNQEALAAFRSETMPAFAELQKAITDDADFKRSAQMSSLGNPSALLSRAGSGHGQSCSLQSPVGESWLSL